MTDIADLPTPIIAALLKSTYDPGFSRISVTSLIDSPKVVALKRRHNLDGKESLEDLWPAFVGSCIHDRLEKTDTIMPVEERHYVTRDGWKIGGQFDRLFLNGNKGGISPNGNGENPKRGELQDWKCILSAASAFPKWEWEAQLNLLGWIMREAGWEITKLTIWALCVDWRKSKVGRMSGYPESFAVPFDIPLWDHSTCEEYVAGRVALHKEAQEAKEQSQMEPCTDRERWAKAATWAVMKEGRKSALRVLDSEEMAQDWIVESLATEKIKAKDEKKLSILKRPGENIRCAGYCEVRDICEQWKELKKGTGDAVG